MSEIEIATDLLTPLGAYLRLRAAAGGSFLLESVERGRLGRYSFVGAGSRLVSFEEAEAVGWEALKSLENADAAARSREAQVLAKTRARLEALEARVAELETQLKK